MNDIKKLEIQADSAKNAARAIDKGIAWVETQKEQLTRELDRLDRERPAYIADMACNSASPDKWNEAHTRSLEIKHLLDDIDGARTILESRKAPYMADLQQANQAINDAKAEKKRNTVIAQAEKLKAAGYSMPKIADELKIGIRELERVLS